MSGTMGEPVRIRMDDREPESIARALSAIEGVTVEWTRLEFGDFEVGPSLFVERKSSSDFGASLLDKRLFTQVKQAKDAGMRLIFVLEGDVFAGARNIHPNAISGALSYLATIEQIPVLGTSAIMLPRLVADIARHSVHGLGYTINLREQRPRDVRESQLYCLQGLPGVGRGKAEALLAHFGSIRKVMAASAQELAAVPGMGAKSAATIAAALDLMA